MAVRGGLKKWKDSAGVILISGAFKYARPPTPISTLVNLGENPLIVPLDELDSSGREWTLTLVKRGSKTGFYGMPLFIWYFNYIPVVTRFNALFLSYFLTTSQHLRLPRWPN